MSFKEQFVRSLGQGAVAIPFALPSSGIVEGSSFHSGALACAARIRALEGR